MGKKKKKERLLTVRKKDLKIQTFRSGGKGGQHQNTTDSGVRIIHDESGAVGESRSERSQHQNKRIALERMAKSEKFKTWTNRRIFELTEGKTLEERVDEMMNPKNLKVEGRNEDGDWKEM